jgi:DNA repair photolyase
MRDTEQNVILEEEEDYMSQVPIFTKSVTVHRDLKHLKNARVDV